VGIWRRYFIIGYPEPPLIDMSQQLAENDDDLSILESLDGMVLAPYFSAIIRDDVTRSTGYYVLGQALDGGATLRRVTPHHNLSLGPGYNPDLNEFLQLLRVRLELDGHAA
jgi:hypothetical protein